MDPLIQQILTQQGLTPETKVSLITQVMSLSKDLDSSRSPTPRLSSPSRESDSPQPKAIDQFVHQSNAQDSKAPLPKPPIPKTVSRSMSQDYNLKSLVAQSIDSTRNLTSTLMSSGTQKEQKETPAYSATHGRLYSTVLKHNQPDVYLKTINVTVSMQPHAPIFLTQLNLHGSTDSSDLSESKDHFLKDYFQNEIFVICCKSHTAELQRMFKHSKVSFVTTLNAQLHMDSDDDMSSTSSVDVYSSVSQQQDVVTYADAASKMSLPAGPPPESTQSGTASQSFQLVKGKRNVNKGKQPQKNFVLPPIMTSTYVSNPESNEVKSSPRTPRALAPPSSDIFSDSFIPTSNFSWSDDVEEQIPLDEPLKHKFKQISAENSLVFYLEIGLIYSRALTARDPRKTLRGILDNTRSKNTVMNGFSISFGNAKFQIASVGMHRHRLNHSATRKGTPAPYQNPGHRDCTELYCPFNFWVQLETENQTDRNFKMSESLFVRLAEKIKKSPPDETGKYQAQSIIDFLDKNKVNVFAMFKQTCTNLIKDTT